MKHTLLPRILTLASLTLGLALAARSETSTGDRLRDQVDVSVPAHLAIESFHHDLVGDPAVKVKLAITLRAAETLYTLVTHQPKVQAITSALTDDLRARQPKELRILKVTLAEGAVSKVMHLDATVSSSPADLRMGPLATNKFTNLGRPRSDFDADLLTEDSPEGIARIGSWNREVDDFNKVLKSHDGQIKRGKIVENAGLFVGGIMPITNIINSIKGKSRQEPAPETVAPAVAPIPGSAQEKRPGVLEAISTNAPSGTVLVKALVGHNAR